MRHKSSLSTQGPLDGPNLVLQQVLDVEYCEISDELLVSLFEGIYSKSSAVNFLSLIDKEVEAIQVAIETQIQQDHKSLISGVRCLENMQPDYVELDERLKEVHRMLILIEKEKSEWNQSKIIYDHLLTTIKALKNSIELIDGVGLIMDELKKPISSCDLHYILQVLETLEVEFSRILPNTELVIYLRRWTIKLHQRIILLAQHQLQMYLSYLVTMEDKVGLYCHKLYGRSNVDSVDHDSSTKNLQQSSMKSLSFVDKFDDAIYAKFPFLEPPETYHDPLSNNSFKVDFESLLNLLGLFKKLCRQNTLKAILKAHRNATLDKIFEIKEPIEQTDKFANLKAITWKLIGHFRINIALATFFPVAFLSLTEVRDSWYLSTEKWRQLLLSSLNALTIETIDTKELEDMTQSFMKCFEFCSYGSFLIQGVLWNMDALKEADHFLFHLAMNRLRLEYSEQLQKIIDTDLLDKQVVNSEGELKVIAQTFAFVHKLYFSDDTRSAGLDTGRLATDLKGLPHDGQESTKSSLKSKRSTIMTTTSNTKVDIDLDLIYPIQLKFSQMIPLIFNLLTAYIEKFVFAMSTNSFHELVPYLKKTLEGFLTGIIVPCLLDRECQSRGQKIQILSNIECLVEITHDLENFANLQFGISLAPFNLENQLVHWKKRIDEKSLIKK